MRLRKDKRIGKVILVVEGARHEFNLMKKVFVDALGYTQIEKRRGSADFYMRQGDRHSMVAVVNTKTSNISSINDREYLDAIFEELIEKYDFDIDNAAIYYVFDRDPKSNTDPVLIARLIEKLKNSRENDEYMRGGMLILSYPSIEAYEISNFVDGSFEIKAGLGKDAKNYISRAARDIAMNKISEDSIVHAGRELCGFLEKKGIAMDLDDFSHTGRAVFEEEELSFKQEQAFRVLSMFSCVLMDLGVMEG
ncbi:MAG: hypothetical protein K2N94_08750 [Lachnospiraceae bacterium]|nr:hypothetical protein [Lachnospiraceae bacterium]